MGRKAYYNNEQFIKAAMDIVIEQGPSAVTVTSIAQRVNAPVGSVYHRFSSREMIMAELWLGITESFQTAFVDLLARDLGLAAALHTPRWVREHFQESRVLLLYRREELMSKAWPEQYKQRAGQLEQQLRSALTDYVVRQEGDISAQKLERTVLVLIDIPLALVKRYLGRKEVPPQHIDDLIIEAYQGILGRAYEDKQRT